jgi:hypothetical protein
MGQFVDLSGINRDSTRCRWTSASRVNVIGKPELYPPIACLPWFRILSYSVARCWLILLQPRSSLGSSTSHRGPFSGTVLARRSAPKTGTKRTAIPPSTTAEVISTRKYSHGPGIPPWMSAALSAGWKRQCCSCRRDSRRQRDRSLCCCTSASTGPTPPSRPESITSTPLPFPTPRAFHVSST